MKRREYQELQHSAYHKEAHCRAEHLGDEEKPCPGAIGRCAEALFKIAVDRYELAPVEQRHQHKGYGKVAYNKAKHHLQVGIAFSDYHTGHADKGNARYRRTYHGKCHKRPRCLATARKEG